jgi:hypothetical protein
VRVVLRWRCARDLRFFVLAADRFFAGFLDSREIFGVRTTFPYGVVDAIAEPVREDGVVHLSVAAVLLGFREMLVGGIAWMRTPVTPSFFNSAATARPRSGSSSTLDMSQP